MKPLFVSSVLIFMLLSSAEVNLHDKLKALIANYQLKPIEAETDIDSAKIALGQALFFDRILSGNKDISCATCHHPDLNAGDNLRLPIGVGGSGLGEAREMGEGREFIPRNSPEIFNRGHAAWNTMFWDGRVAGTSASGFITPAHDTPARYFFPRDFDNILAVQAMFPVTSRDEMRGEIGEYDVNGVQNELALISNAAPHSVWRSLMLRLMEIPEYQEMFEAAYPGRTLNELGFEHAANAIAAFEISAFTFTNSPWDRYLAGDDQALTESALRGATLFYGKANCVSCHSGDLFTNQDYHNIGVPQFGPGKDNAAPLDAGRYAETGDPQHLFAFRTPPLRNVSLTGPWMHNGAYNDLEDVIRHHLNPAQALSNYEDGQLPDELRATYKGNPQVIDKILSHLDPKVRDELLLNDKEIDDLTAFLHALTDSAAVDMRHTVPMSVPSGLPVDNQGITHDRYKVKNNSKY